MIGAIVERSRGGAVGGDSVLDTTLVMPCRQEFCLQNPDKKEKGQLLQSRPVISLWACNASVGLLVKHWGSGGRWIPRAC